MAGLRSARVAERDDDELRDELSALWRTVEDGGGETVAPIVRAAGGARACGLRAAAVIRALALGGHEAQLQALSEQADAQAPHAGLFAATLRVARVDTPAPEAVDACAEAWSPPPPRSGFWATVEPDVLLSGFHDPRKRADVRAAVAARAEDADLVEAMTRDLQPRLRGRSAKEQRFALTDVRNLARAGMFVPLVPDVERLLAAKAAATREAADEALGALAGCDPAEARADALPELRALDPSATSYAARRAGVVMRALGRAGALRGEVDAALCRQHPGAVVEHALGHGDGDALRAVYEAQVEAAQTEGLFAEIATSFRQRAVGPADAPAALAEVLVQEWSRVGELRGSALVVALWAAPHHALDAVVPWLATLARDTSPGRWQGTWLVWTGGKTTWSEIAIRVLGRLAQRSGSTAARDELDALTGEKKKLVSAMAGRASAIAAAALEDEAWLHALVRHRNAAVREGAYWGLAHGVRSYGDALTRRGVGSLAKRVPPAVFEVGLTDRSKAVREQALQAVQVAGITASSLPAPDVDGLAGALRGGGFDAVKQAQAHVVAWCERGHSPEELAPLVPALGDSAMTGPSIGPAAAHLAERGVDVQPLIAVLAGSVVSEPVPTASVEGLRRLVAHADTALADPYVRHLLEHPRRARALHVAALRYLEARRRRGASFRLPAWVLEAEDLGALGLSVMGPEGSDA